MLDAMDSVDRSDDSSPRLESMSLNWPSASRDDGFAEMGGSSAVREDVAIIPIGLTSFYGVVF